MAPNREFLAFNRPFLDEVIFPYSPWKEIVNIFTIAPSEEARKQHDFIRKVLRGHFWAPRSYQAT